RAAREPGWTGAAAGCGRYLWRCVLFSPATYSRIRFAYGIRRAGARCADADSRTRTQVGARRNRPAISRGVCVDTLDGVVAVWRTRDGRGDVRGDCGCVVVRGVAGLLGTFAAGNESGYDDCSAL